MTNSRKPIFIKGSIANIVIIAFGIHIYANSLKSKSEFETVKGKIDYIGDSFENLNPRDTRYIHIEGYPLVFQVFIGKETGDFSPKFEQLDKLKIGDEIIAYHSDITPLQKNRDTRLDKNLEFIDKDNKPYFVKGNKNKIGGIFFISVGLFLTIGLIVLKKLKKYYKRCLTAVSSNNQTQFP
ncbi:hypothetical protein [Flavobacterium phycosphaerae]|uniref:hypothetical protein n=1 Tax=Flavobacterium phycosphaerae TaxID=2697515 RepID=UPI00138A0D51|nr:hypothetical protein [Flavobacterium phycosphaerae]